ncbi:ATP-binding protein [Fibrobacter sp.]|uniref:ATP-binding protein n=1 Tax=Fibrobacter sp. TaxID=35828 RepID=UPI00388FDB18
MRVSRNLYLNRLVSRKHNGMIKIVTGIRRCGKSFLLFDLFGKHLEDSGVPADHIVKVDLEDRHNKHLRNPDALMAHIDGMLTDENMHYVLLDEVQYVDEFEDVLNSYLKKPNVDVYVTGSNSRFLSKDVITEFRGRGDEIKITPLSFGEFMSAYDGDNMHGLAEYLTYGGMPKLFDIKDEEGKADYLRNLFMKTYLTDIEERYNIKNCDDLAELIDVIASSIGGLTNPLKLSNTFKSVKNAKISQPTIKTYLEILQDVFLVKKAVRYDIKGRRYIDTPAKYYFEDLGLRNARLNFRQQESTHLVENLIYNELRIRGMSVDVGVVAHNVREDGKNVRKQLEVDFVCNQGSKRYYIQSALHIPTEEKMSQELESLKRIDDSFLKFVITNDPVKKHQDENGIVIMNLFDFLLDSGSLSI